MATPFEVTAPEFETFSYDGTVLNVHRDRTQLQEFHAMFVEGTFQKPVLTRSVTGTLKDSFVRSLCWRCTMGYFDDKMFENMNKTEKWYEPQYSRYKRELVDPAAAPTSSSSSAIASNGAPASTTPANSETPAHPEHPTEGEATLTPSTTTEATPPAESTPPLPASNSSVFEQWVAAARTHRERYAQLIEKHSSSDQQGDEDLEVNNPLSDNADSPWQKYFKKNKLEKTVEQDIERLHFDNDFFRSTNVRRMLTRMLVFWALENESIDYRQGMHEVMSLILLVCWRDARQRALDRSDYSPNDTKVDSDTADGAVLDQLLDTAFIEHDCYALYNLLLTQHSLQSWYQKVYYIGTGKPLSAVDKVSAIPAAADNDDSNAENQGAVIRDCNRIQGQLLKQYDPAVFAHLNNLGIEPQVYLLKWLRLLFLREFHIEDVLVVWDAIFADIAIKGVEITNFVPHIALAMIRFMRDNLLGSDYNTAIRRLLRFPPCNDVHILVRKAVLTRYPNDELLIRVLKEPPPKPEPIVPPPDIINSPIRPAANPPSIVAPAVPSSPRTFYSNTSRAKPTLPQLQREVDACYERETRLGKRLEHIIEGFQTKWFCDPRPTGTEVATDDEFVLALAELRAVRDVLSGRVPDEMPENRGIVVVEAV